MKQRLIMGAMIGVMAVVGVTPVFALHEESHQEGAANETVEEPESTSNTSTNVDKTEKTQNRGANVEERLKQQRAAIEEKKTMLRDEMKQLRETKKASLEGRRLAQCQNRQADINALMLKSVQHGRDRLSRIQRFEEGAKAFYEKQGLASESYDSALQAADAKEAAAIAAIDVMAAEKFQCANADGDKPSGEIQTARVSKRQALGEYRDSVKALIVVIKEAFIAKQAAGKAED